MPLELLLAFRFLAYSTTEKNISSMIKICFFSILIGTFSLALVSAIMNGFEKETYKKLQGIHADVLIDAGTKSIDYIKIKQVLTKEYSSTILASSPTAFSHVLLSHDGADSSYNHLCILKAVDPTTEPLVTTLQTLFTSSKSPPALTGSIKPSVSLLSPEAVAPWKKLTSHTIFIGHTLAERLHVKEGDSAVLLYPEEKNLGRHISLFSKPVTIAALYKTGIQDFDEHVIMASFELVKELYPPTVNQVVIKLAPHADEKEVISSLRTRLALPVYSWKDLYPPLLAALTLEKYAMFFIVGLVSLVASLTIIALLFMYATEKRTEIALLKSMGMTDNALNKLFMYISLFITLGGTLCGIVCAALATSLLKKFPFIKLPDAYYVTHLPAELAPTIILSVVVFACIVGIGAALLPLQKIKSMNVANVLKGLPT
ncbi:ABC transporter permease [Candidatus Dependentiae bacterium]|nr:ABC transporter permease [Candidatus Dependentiae bacterium]